MNYKMTFPDSKVSITFSDPYDVYEYLVESVYKCNLTTVDEETHLRAADVQCWCELAGAGDSYEDKDFSVECVYSFSL